MSESPGGLTAEDGERRPLPRGTVTFLFSDIEGSTRLLLKLGPDYPLVLQQHRELLREVFARQGGIEVGTEGDSFFVAFAKASDAAAAALEGQQKLMSYPWPQDAALSVRMGLHTGEVSYSEERGYTGLPVHEAARISNSAHGGQILMSQVARDLVEESLPPGAYLRHLGLHRLKDLPLPQRIYQLCHPDVPSEFPPVRTLGTADRLLPAQPTPLVGRQREAAELIAALKDPAVRLVTVTGPGGIGKTRLAVEVAGRVAGDFEEGVVYVPLASVRHPILVISGIAQALGVRESEEEALLDNVTTALADRQVLLVLDNFEQVIEAASDLAKLLAAAPRTKVLVTSRMILNLRGEWSMDLPPLERPDEHLHAGLEDLARNESVRLFVQRAQAARSDFTLNQRNAGAVAGICRKLDGLPLAIELAAARVRVLPPKTLFRRLSSTLALLTAGSRDLPDRQQTLRNTIDWSFDLLGEGERRLLAELAVFLESRTLDAIEEVCTGADFEDLLENLRSLVEKSFLRQEDTPEGEANFIMLGVIREYALEKLTQSGRLDEMRERHARYFIEFARTAATELRGPDQASWIQAVEREHANIRLAIAWADERDDPHSMLDIMRAIWQAWWAKAHVGEGYRWCERIIARLDSLSPRERAEAQWYAAAFARSINLIDRSLELAEAALVDAEEAGDERILGFVHKELGTIAVNVGDWEGAERHDRESIRTFRRVGETLGLVEVLNNLGVTLALEDRPKEALEPLYESLRLAEKLQDAQGIARSHLNLGAAHRDMGDLENGRKHLCRSLELWYELGGIWDIVDVLSDLAALAVREGRFERAARMMGATDALRRSINAPAATYEEAVVTDTMEACRRELGGDRLEELWNQGLQVELEDVMAYALEADEASAS